MLMLRVTYHVKPGMRDAFVKALQEEEIAASTRREEGNVDYAFSLPLDDPDTLFLLELWESKENLGPHGKQPKFLRLQELKAEYVESSDILFYDAQPKVKKK